MQFTTHVLARLIGQVQRYSWFQPAILLLGNQLLGFLRKSMIILALKILPSLWQRRGGHDQISHPNLAFIVIFK